MLQVWVFGLPLGFLLLFFLPCQSSVILPLVGPVGGVFSACSSRSLARGGAEPNLLEDIRVDLEEEKGKKKKKEKKKKKKKELEGNSGGLKGRSNPNLLDILEFQRLDYAHPHLAAGACDRLEALCGILHTIWVIVESG